MNETLDSLSKAVYLSLSHGELAGEPGLEDEFQMLVKSLKLPEVENFPLILNEMNSMTLREDNIRPSLTREQVLENAPETKAGCFIVPKTV